MQHFLAFDLGAESGRAVIGTLGDSGRLTLREVRRFATPGVSIDGHLHWDVPRIWEELRAALRTACEELKAAGGSLSGIGVDTWGVDYALLDEAGDTLSPPFAYRDSRTAGVMERAFAIVPREDIYAGTGLQLLPFNTLFQLIAEKRDRPAALVKTKTLLFIPDLLNYFLTGRRTCEASIASTGQMLDPRSRTWAVALLEKFALPTHMLAEIVQPGSIIGSLKADLARETGCDDGASIPVIAPGCHDTASAVAAVPASTSDWCYISSGTWSLMGVELDRPLIDGGALAHNFTNEVGVAGTTRFLRNIMGLWLVQECRRDFAARGAEHSYEELMALAANAGEPETVIDPDFPAFFSPGNMPAKIAGYCARTGQAPPRDVGETIRLCLGGLAMSYRRTLAHLEELLGRRLDTIHVVGGGCRNALLNQMTADACDRTVLSGPVEATAIGNVLVQAMALGTVKSLEGLRAIVRASFDVRRFEPRAAGRYDAHYARFCELAAQRDSLKLEPIS